MKRFAVILTHNRRELLAQTVEAIGPQVDHVIVIDNGTNPPVRMSEILPDVRRDWTTQLVYDERPVNLARLWQRGLTIARSMSVAGISPSTRLVPVAFLCDDAPPPPLWFQTVTEAMQRTGAAAGASAPDPFGWQGEPDFKTTPDGNVTRRMPGWAFILNAAVPALNFDERFVWWWNDTDMDWQARANGGMVLTGWPAVPNVHPNDFTASKPELGAQVGRDRLAFQEKWGGCPW